MTVWNSCLLLFWMSGISTSKHHYHARVTIGNQGMSRVTFPNADAGLMKFVSKNGSQIIWMARNNMLYSINVKQEDKPKPVNVTLLWDEAMDSQPPLGYKISLLTEGSDENPLFYCGHVNEKTRCCNLNSSYMPSDCFPFSDYKLEIDQPSLLVGEMLFFALSKKGLYKKNVKNPNDNIWPQSPQADLKYLKLVPGRGQHKDKFYSFAQKYNNKGEYEEWVPLVYQSCTNDRGGNKNLLENSWTSMISARMECGKDFTKLIDVSSVETDHDTKIYALFRNYWNMSAVCVYNMTEISDTFTSSDFNSINVSVNPRPGTCAKDSTQLSNELLKVMKKCPEIKKPVKPEKRPLVFRHRRYTHLQVDQVQNSIILLLALESGGVDKVLKNPLEEPVSTIAEYQPLPQGSNITGLFLHTSEKRLFVSSQSELVQMNLTQCEVYGDKCTQCLLSKDPYCQWNGTHCSAATRIQVQDSDVCGELVSVLELSKATIKEGTVHCHYNMHNTNLSSADSPVASHSRTVTFIPASSKHFLLCPMMSKYASYHWIHKNEQKECVFSDQSCMFLIDSMNETYEGFYSCESKEGKYQSSIVQYELRMSRNSGVSLVLIPYFSLSLTALHFLL
ncbi:hypothetical protein DNTS_033371 [Danionella cerebrum]|uniref:Sema domain-containing protein n=1 Tax=Danionella cerebrum TaxID=2873325 RepID=A0A553QJR9_9TELE|nr:hypothetical protein DNTS_033371 [Danionella translucida]